MTQFQHNHCGNCGALWTEHTHSRKTYTGCPWCEIDRLNEQHKRLCEVWNIVLPSGGDRVAVKPEGEKTMKPVKQARDAQQTALVAVSDERDKLRGECDRLRGYYHEVAETCCEMRAELERLMDIVCEDDRRIIEQILGLESEVDED